MFNKANTPLGVDFDALIGALQQYIDRFIVPVWATPAKPNSVKFDQMG
ncbi:MAG TPA: hypothetical protein VJT80_22235 [Steroidobacteraceae bacterium]|nr:hypothetical protein [Steroidobacteraceae bacterium]